MTNEFKNLTDYEVLDMYEKAILAYRNSPRIMPLNDRNYLLQRKVQLRAELVRRYGANQVGHFLSEKGLTNK
jgi:hypothetical protein